MDPWSSTQRLALLEAVAKRAIAYLTAAGGGAIPVSRPLAPEALARRFEQTLALSLADAPGASLEDVLDALDEVIECSVHTAHPRFFNQNFAGPDPIAVAGDWLATALNTTAATYEMAPVFTLMERALLDRLARLAGWDAAPTTTDDAAAPPPRGLMLPGGSTSNLLAIQLARHRACPEINREGDRPNRWALFTSQAAHYSIGKSARLMGLGDASVFTVACDNADRMDPRELERAFQRAEDAGRRPLFVNATAGTTVRAAFDPLDDIAQVCSARGVWMHVDGCFGASALFASRAAHLMRGVERADSLAWNLHKVMGMTQQCAALLIRNPSQLRPCFASSATYLFQPDKPHGALDAGDLGFQCARRVDVLKAWLTWKAVGDQGMARRVEHALDCCAHLADTLRTRGSNAGWQLLDPTSFVSVCFRWIPPSLRHVAPSCWSPAQRAELHRLQVAIRNDMAARGLGMLAAQPVADGINCLRLLVMNPAVQLDDLHAILTAIEVTGTRLAGATSASASTPEA